MVLQLLRLQAEYRNDICSLPITLVTHMVKHAQQQGFCVAGNRNGVGDAVDDEACIITRANVFYRTIYHRGTA